MFIPAQRGEQRSMQSTYAYLLQRLRFLLIPGWHQKHKDVTVTCTTRQKSRLDVVGQESSEPGVSIASLPPEVHHMIASHLSYPDLLSLKLTDKYFDTLISPKLNVRLRVDWVRNRISQHLPVPKRGKLSFRNDSQFVSNAEVKLILRRRRKHLECIDCDKEFRQVVNIPFVAVETGGNGGEHAFALGEHDLVTWKKGCLVTGQKFCIRVQEMELRQQRFRNSVLGRLCSCVQTAAQAVSRQLGQLWRLSAYIFRRRYRA
jgi:hypothetical protein